MRCWRWQRVVAAHLCSKFGPLEDKRLLSKVSSTNTVVASGPGRMEETVVKSRPQTPLPLPSSRKQRLDISVKRNSCREVCFHGESETDVSRLSMRHRGKTYTKKNSLFPERISKPQCPRPIPQTMAQGCVLWAFVKTNRTRRMMLLVLLATTNNNDRRVGNAGVLTDQSVFDERPSWCDRRGKETAYHVGPATSSSFFEGGPAPGPSSDIAGRVA